MVKTLRVENLRTDKYHFDKNKLRIYFKPCQQEFVVDIIM